jgi:hypothetical protein
MWQLLIVDPNFEIHTRSLNIRNIHNHNNPIYTVIGPFQQVLNVTLSNGTRTYESLLEAQFSAHPEVLAPFLIKKELRETLILYGYFLD